MCFAQFEYPGMEPPAGLPPSPPAAAQSVIRWGEPVQPFQNPDVQSTSEGFYLAVSLPEQVQDGSSQIKTRSQANGF